MFIFKTSGETLPSVVRNKKHAFLTQPVNWEKGEIVLISKNKLDCERREPQIQFVAEIDKVRPVLGGEIQELWPGHQGQWDYIVDFSRVVKLKRPFNLNQVIPDTAIKYGPVMTHAKFSKEEELKIWARIKEDLS